MGLTHRNADPIRLPRAGLQMAPEEMRRLGHLVVDMVVEHLAELPSKPVANIPSRADLERALGDPLPTGPSDPGEVIARLQREVLSAIAHSDHPRFFAFVPGPSNFMGFLGDVVAAGFNIDASVWATAAGPAELELVVVDWLRQLLGLPMGAGGLFVSGGSVAGLTALLAARHDRLGPRFHDGVAYCSDQTHSSIERALRVLGFRADQLRKLPTDGGFQIRMDLLQQAIDADRNADRRPFCVIANAGTTNTGAVDPLEDIAGLCRREGLWLHIDGAIGAAAVLCDSGARLLAGVGAADSITIDPHKWLFQPFEMGCLLLRDRRILRSCLTVRPEYLQDTATGEINFSDFGIQLTRGARAIKLWLSMQTFGIEAFAASIQHSIELAEYTEALLRAGDEWEVVTPAQLGIVTFRWIPRGRSPAGEVMDQLQQRIVQRMLVERFALVLSTTLRGRRVLRICINNPRTTEDDVRATIDQMARLGRELEA